MIQSHRSAVDAARRYTSENLPMTSSRLPAYAGTARQETTAHTFTGTRSHEIQGKRQCPPQRVHQPTLIRRRAQHRRESIRMLPRGPLPATIRYTHLPSEFATATLTEIEESTHAFLTRLSGPIPYRDHKRGAMMVGCTFQAKNGTVPVRRKQDIALYYVLVLDVDRGMTIENARELFDSVAGVIYTTFNHTDEKPRFRIVLPLSAPVTPVQFQVLAGWMLSYCGETEIDGRTSSRIDTCVKNLSQGFYLPGSDHPENGTAFRLAGLDAFDALQIAEVLNAKGSGAEFLTPRRLSTAEKKHVAVGAGASVLIPQPANRALKSLVLTGSDRVSSDGAFDGFRVERCPACGEGEGNPIILETGRLQCFRSSCLASGRGLSLYDWLARFAPDARQLPDPAGEEMPAQNPNVVRRACSNRVLSKADVLSSGKLSQAGAASITHALRAVDASEGRACLVTLREIYDAMQEARHRGGDAELKEVLDRWPELTLDYYGSGGQPQLRIARTLILLGDPVPNIDEIEKKAVSNPAARLEVEEKWSYALISCEVAALAGERGTHNPLDIIYIGKALPPGPAWREVEPTAIPKGRPPKASDEMRRWCEDAASKGHALDAFLFKTGWQAAGLARPPGSLATFKRVAKEVREKTIVATRSQAQNDY